LKIDIYLLATNTIFSEFYESILFD